MVILGMVGRMMHRMVSKVMYGMVSKMMHRMVGMMMVWMRHIMMVRLIDMMWIGMARMVLMWIRRMIRSRYCLRLLIDWEIIPRKCWSLLN